MKYVDVHTHRSQSLAHAQLPSVAKGLFAKKKKSKTINYKFRFYMVIGFILLSSFYYLRHQIKAEEPSVFKDLYTIVASRLSKVELPTSSVKPKPVAKPKPTPSPASKARHKQPQKTSPGKQPIVYYFPKMDSQNRIVFSPKKGFFSSSSAGAGASLYADIISGLTQNSLAGEEDTLEVFPDEVKLRKAWVEKKVLLLDFNKAFEQGRFGDKGLEIQLQQILWTLFKAPLLSGNFEHISFLIDGQRRTQLGGHGIPLKPFYSKKDLRRHIHAR